VSGLDTSTIVDKLMLIERKGLDKLTKQKSQLLARQQAYRDLNTKVLSLRTAAKALSDSNTVLSYKATPSDTAKLSATADATASAGIYNIEILAKSTQSKLVGASDVGAKIDPTKALNSADVFGSAFVGGTFTVNGQQFTVSGSDTLNDVLSSIAAMENMTASYSEADDTVTLASASAPLVLGSATDTSNFLALLKVESQTVGGAPYSSTSSSKLGRLNVAAAMNDAGANGLRSKTAVTNGGEGSGTLTINGVDISYDVAVDGLSDVLKRINDSSAGVTATFDATNDRLVLTNKTGGSTGITVADTKGNLGEALGLTTGTMTYGSNAQIAINGGSPVHSTDDVFTGAETGITGLSLTLTASSGSTTVSVATDQDGLKSKLDAFVKAYNDVINFIAEKTKTSGTGKDATVGPLNGLQDVMVLQRNLRSMLSQSVSGISSGPASLGSIGLGTTGASATISLDTAKLTSALSDYAGNVIKVLADSTEGVMGKVSNYIDTQTRYGVGPLAQKAERMEPGIRRVNETIRKFNARMEATESRLVKQFAAMEKAISDLKAGATSLFNELGV